MARSKKKLRGSVTQNFASSRGKDNGERTLGGFLLRLGVIFIFFGGLIGGCWWLWHDGWPQRKIQQVFDFSIDMTKKAEFSVKNVVVEGRQQTDKTELIGALNTYIGAPILLFDPDAALKRIERMPWVAKAVVIRRLPDTIYVKITEREPLARWQHAGKTVIIDREGRDFPSAKVEDFPNLPLVIGDNAPKEAEALLVQLRDFPLIISLLDSAVRVSDRRWNLYIKPKILIKLPERNVRNALERLTQLISEQKILEKSVISVDLRLSDRLFIDQGTPPQESKDKS